jgi:hypothetical protein
MKIFYVLTIILGLISCDDDKTTYKNRINIIREVFPKGKIYENFVEYIIAGINNGYSIEEQFTLVKKVLKEKVNIK